MHVLITGANGQLGFDLAAELTKRGHTVTGTDLAPSAVPGLKASSYLPLDITDEAAVSGAFERLRPDAAAHCAAWTQVDAAEDPANVPAVERINRDGTRFVARAAASAGAKLLYLSTDYVFGGGGTDPWRADETRFAPLNVYGRTKLEGERAVADALTRFFIVRISWVFGRNGRNFIRTMLELGVKRDELRVVCDQIGAPTYTPDLSRLLADMLESEAFGRYHATNSGGDISWYDLASEAFRAAGCPARLVPVTTEAYGLSRAERPRNSRLDKSALTAAGFDPLPDWRDAVGRYIAELDAEGLLPRYAPAKS